MSWWTKTTVVVRASLVVETPYSQPMYFSGLCEGDTKEWKVERTPFTDEHGEQRHEVELYHNSSYSIYIDNISYIPCKGRPLYLIGNLVPGGNLGWTKIDLPRVEYKSMTLIVTYRVKGFAPPPPAPMTWTPPEPSLIPLPRLPTLSADLEKLFLAESSSDVAFEIGEQIIPAHKCILTARVPAFESMFSSDMKEAKTGRIRINDTDAASFKHALRFVYCGKFPDELNEVAGSLLPIAEKYGIQELKDASEANLKSQMSRNNVINTLVLAHVYHCSDLKKACFNRLSGWKKSLDAGDIETLKSLPDLMAEAFQMT